MNHFMLESDRRPIKAMVPFKAVAQPELSPSVPSSMQEDEDVIESKEVVVLMNPKVMI
jgi:hypothetical protein